MSELYVIKSDQGRYATGSAKSPSFRELNRAKVFSKQELKEHLKGRCEVFDFLGSMRNWYNQEFGSDVSIVQVSIEEKEEIEIDDFE